MAETAVSTSGSEPSSADGSFPATLPPYVLRESQICREDVADRRTSVIYLLDTNLYPKIKVCSIVLGLCIILSQAKSAYYLTPLIE